MIQDRECAFSTVSGDGVDVPLFVVEFDAAGRLQSPRQRDALVDAVRRGTVADVHVYSHGWNNVFDVALTRYAKFFRTYLSQRQRFAGAPGATDISRTAFAGVIWPSTALVSPAQQAPRIGARPAAPDDATLQAADEVALALGVDTTVLRDYLRRPALSADEAAEFVKLVFPVLAASDEVAARGPKTIDESWLVLAKLGEPPDSAETVFEDDEPPAGVNVFTGLPVGTDAKLGGVAFRSLDARAVIRALSVYVMKDRARTVGADGVGPELIRPLLDANQNARLHLIGHSFGSAVQLSALCGSDLARPVGSTLLLEPAISWLCFSSDVGNGVAGGYEQAPRKSTAPILATHSALDRELTDFYKLALLRKSDIGDPMRLGAFDPFERFKPLGGYGPSPVNLTWPHHPAVLAPAGTPYPPAPRAARIISFDGSGGTIRDHGDVDNAHTAWLHASNVDGGAFAP